MLIPQGAIPGDCLTFNDEQLQLNGGCYFLMQAMLHGCFPFPQLNFEYFNVLGSYRTDESSRSYMTTVTEITLKCLVLNGRQKILVFFHEKVKMVATTTHNKLYA